jgi:hypothetical protein
VSCPVLVWQTRLRLPLPGMQVQRNRPGRAPEHGRAAAAFPAAACQCQSRVPWPSHTSQPPSLPRLPGNTAVVSRRLLRRARCRAAVTSLALGRRRGRVASRRRVDQSLRSGLVGYGRHESSVFDSDSVVLRFSHGDTWRTLCLLRFRRGRTPQNRANSANNTGNPSIHGITTSGTRSSQKTTRLVLSRPF